MFCIKKYVCIEHLSLIHKNGAPGGTLGLLSVVGWPKYHQLPASAMPPMQQALQTGWFDATFPSTSGLSAMLGPEVLAEVAAFRMALGSWSQGFEVLSSGLSAGYPDACAYQRPFTVYVEYALAKHRELSNSGTGADIWVDRLKELFVLQAYNLRYILTTKS